MADKFDNVTALYSQFKTEAEKQKFIQRLNDSILHLGTQLKQRDEEIYHLKSLLSNAIPLVGDAQVQRIIVSKEEALIDGQIDIIQNRSLMIELSLEDIKKLDLLLKNKMILKRENPDTFDGKPKTPSLSKAELLKIAKQEDEK